MKSNGAPAARAPAPPPAFVFSVTLSLYIHVDIHVYVIIVIYIHIYIYIYMYPLHLCVGSSFPPCICVYCERESGCVRERENRTGGTPNFSVALMRAWGQAPPPASVFRVKLPPCI